MYRPSSNFNVAMKIIAPSSITEYNGVKKAEYPAIEQVGESMLFFGSFKTYGGTDNNVNGVYSVTDTAVIEAWYRPDIVNNCRIAVLSTGGVYEIMNTPENIEMRNQFLKIKVKRVGGKLSG